jgi:iron complex outermembrane receptor protein
MLIIFKSSKTLYRYLFLILILLSTIKTFAQENHMRISGKVIDRNGMAISGVNVSLKNNAIGTITDEKGNFLLKLPSGDYTLVASYTGYTSAEQQVKISTAQVNLIFKLAVEDNLMQEVTINGQKKQSAAATRTAMPLQNIPQAITVIGQKIIQQQASFDLASIAKNITGLNFTGNYSGAGSSQFFNARGFDLNDSQNYRWNGVMIWNWGNQYADNIEQVEFLKGPTSILFGDVAPGGVMNFVTKKPLANFMANVDFKTGSWGLVRPALDLTGPITKDRTLRYRLNTSYERSDSFRDKVSSERKFIAPAIAWDITPKLALSLEGVFRNASATDDAGLVSPDGTINGLNELDPSLYLGEPSRKYLYRDQSYFSTLSYELNHTWRIKTTAFYSNTTNRPFGLWFDQPNTEGDYVRREYGFYQKAKNGTLSVDIYGSFYTKTIKHNILFGFEYQSTTYRQTNGGELSILDENNIYSPVYGQSLIAEPQETPFRPYITGINRRGIHLQDQMMFFNEKLHVLLGVRFGRTKQGNNYLENDLQGTAYENYTDDIISKNIVTPRFGIVYKIKSNQSVYASYSKGYEINAPDVFAQNYLAYSSPPATLSSQLEFGVKMNLLDNKLGLTLSAFEINKHHPYGYVYLDPINPNYDLYNVYYEGHHQSKGLELEADGFILPGLSLTGGMAFTDAKVIFDPGYDSGNKLPGTPKFTANGWINYQPTKAFKGFDFSTGIFYKSSFYSGIQNNPDLKIPAGYTWDVAMGYNYKKIGMRFNVMNITNQVSYLNPWQFNLFDVKPLRQFTISLNYRIQK